MTGLDSLRAELKKRGFTSQQAGAKVVIEVLEIMTGDPGVYRDLAGAEAKIAAIADQERKLNERAKELAEWTKRLGDWERRVTEYADKFNDSLNNCDTPEGKDSMRAAQMFINTVTPETPQNQTAFISGLAAILSRGGAGAGWPLEKMPGEPEPPKEEA